MPIILILSSCESMITDVEIPENKTEQKLVIISYISPEDSIINVKLYKSVPYYNNAGIVDNDFLIEDGTIILSDGTITKQFAYDNTTKQYVCTDNTFKVEPGVEYTLTASTPDGKTNRAKCTIVPNRVENFSFEITDSIINGEFSNDQIEYIFDVSIPDIPNQENYYRFLVYNSEDTMNTYASINEYITDERLDGQDIKFKTNIFVSDTTKKLDVYLLTCDKAYYEYFQSIMNSYGDTPFTEPSLIYSNTESGMGVFCSYRWIKKEFQIK